MAVCKNLPQDLIAAIVDNIQDDKKSLTAFSLVRKAWTNPARKHLFASLTISGFARLEEIKAANIASTYTPFLHHLALTSQVPHKIFWQEVMPFLTDLRTPRLRSLALNNFTWPGHSLSPDERSAFLRRFESIISLRLSLLEQNTTTDIATIICSLPHLQTLTLRPSFYRCAFPRSSPLLPGLHLPERLSTLHIYYCYLDYRSFLEWLGSVSPRQLRSIHTFKITMRWLLPRDFDTVNMFLRGLGPSLEVFECDCSEHRSIDLTYNTRIRCLDFHFSGPKISSEHVLFAMSTLSRIGSRQVEQVAFHSVSWGLIDETFSMIQWTQMDAILAGPQFATLQHVRISGLPSTHDLPTLLATSLPTCHARDLISFVEPPLWES